MKTYSKHKKFVWGFIAGTVVGPMILSKIAPQVKAKLPG